MGFFPQVFVIPACLKPESSDFGFIVTLSSRATEGSAAISL
jgi:hypothetical protein